MFNNQGDTENVLWKIIHAMWTRFGGQVEKSFSQVNCLQSKGIATV